VKSAGELALLRQAIDISVLGHKRAMACMRPAHPNGHANSVPLSNNLEVLELPGVYAVGPGVFPRLGPANPALTIVAVSRWMGEFLTRGAA
jgi:choline dehydrogenase-like flavoprotein